jgi:hypothetical protein
LAGDLAKHAFGLDDFLSRLLAVDAPPVSVRPTVRPNRHARSDEFANIIGSKPAGIAEQAGEHEEFSLEPTVEQPRERDLHVGRVAIVKGYADIVAVGDRVERLLELLDTDPCLVFARSQVAVGWSDSMHGDVHASCCQPR